MVFLGVDQSLNQPGFALVGEDGTVLRGSSLKVAGNARGGKRLSHIVAFMCAFVGQHKPLAIAMEGASLGSVHREFDLGSAFGVVQYAAFRYYGIEPVIISPSQVKQYGTGRGQATKEEMLYAVRTAFSFPTDDDNIADAVVLAHIARSIHTQIPCSTRVQQEVVREFLPSTPRKSKVVKIRKSHNNL